MTWNTYTEHGKLCRACKEVKPLSAFYMHKRDGKQSLCKVCKYKQNRTWERDNREHVNKLRNEWKRRNPEKVAATVQRYNSLPATKAKKAAQWLQRRYGLTATAHQHMLAQQSGRCAICSDHMVRPNVDHDHVTGAVRGLLCGPCNKGLGHFRDDPQLLKLAVHYLELCAARKVA